MVKKIFKYQIFGSHKSHHHFLNKIV